MDVSENHASYRLEACLLLTPDASQAAQGLEGSDELTQAGGCCGALKQLLPGVSL